MAEKRESKPSFAELMRKYSATEVEFITSGSIIIDTILGGGVPRGRFIEVTSESGLGKTTLVLYMCKFACNSGEAVLYLDYEKAVNMSQLEGIGLSKFLVTQDMLRENPKLDLSGRFIWLQPGTFEEGEAILEAMPENVKFAYIVLDSLTSAVPGKMLSMSIADVEPGLHARFSASFLIKFKNFANTRGITFFYINQQRTKINFRGMTGVVPAGGKANEFYQDIRIELFSPVKLEKMVDTAEGKQRVPYGVEVKVQAFKNKFERPFIPLTLTILYGKGVSNIAAYMKWMEDRDMISQGGSWFTINFKGQEYKAQGKDGVMTWIKENVAEVRKYIEENGGFRLVRE